VLTPENDFLEAKAENSVVHLLPLTMHTLDAGPSHEVQMEHKGMDSREGTCMACIAADDVGRNVVCMPRVDAHAEGNQVAAFHTDTAVGVAYHSSKHDRQLQLLFAHALDARTELLVAPAESACEQVKVEAAVADSRISRSEWRCLDLHGKLLSLALLLALPSPLRHHYNTLVSWVRNIPSHRRYHYPILHHRKTPPGMVVAVAELRLGAELVV
jgi:hypothetical protein